MHDSNYNFSLTTVVNLNQKLLKTLQMSDSSEVPSPRFCFAVLGITVILESIIWKRTFEFQTADAKFN